MGQMGARLATEVPAASVLFDPALASVSSVVLMAYAPPCAEEHDYPGCSVISFTQGLARRATLVVIAARQKEPLSLCFQPRPSQSWVSCQLGGAAAFDRFGEAELDHERRVDTQAPETQRLCV